jgi:hypothetical protein
VKDDKQFPFRNPSVSVRPVVVFPGSEPEGKVTTQPRLAKFKVRKPFRIVVDGNAHTGGETVTLPDDENTGFWLRAGWIERVATAKKGD